MRHLVIALLLLLFVGASAEAAPVCPLTQARLSPSLAIGDLGGDGLSDIVASKRVGSQVLLRWIDSSNADIQTVGYHAQWLALSDYNGDGITEVAGITVNDGQLLWTVSPSNTSSTVHLLAGVPGSTIFLGCHLLNPKRSAVTVATGRAITAIDIVDGTETVISFRGIGRADPLGCGDVDGDGIDELFFRTSGDSPRTDAISVVATSGKIVRRYLVPRFRSGGMVRWPCESRGAVSLFQSVPSLRRWIQIVAFRKGVYIPSFFTSKAETFVSALVTDAQNVSSALWWQSRDSQDVFGRRLIADAPIEHIATLPTGYMLIKTTGIFRAL